MQRRRHCGLCSWAALLLFYTVSVHVQGAQSQSTTTYLPVTPLPSTINPNTVPASTRSTPSPPTPPTVPDSQSTVTNSSVSTVQLTTSDFSSSTPDRTTAVPSIPTTTPEAPTPTPITSPQITTTSNGLPTTTSEITTLISTTTPEPPTTIPTTTPQIITTSHDLPATTPETTYIPTTTPEPPTTTPTTTTPQITTTTPEITTPTPPAPTTAPESPTTVPTTTPQLISTSTDLPSTPPPVTTTDLPPTTPQITTTRTPTTSPQITITDVLTATPHIATTNASVTTPLITTTDVSTTLPQITTADVPVTTPEITTPVSSTPMPTTTPQIIAVTPDFPTPEPTTTNPLVQTTTPVPPTTTPDPTTTPERTTAIPTTTPVPPTPTPDIPTTTPQIIAVTPNVPTPEPTTTNPPVLATTPAPTTMPAPTTTTERTTTIPTTTPEAPTPTPDIPTTPIITTTTTTDLPTPEITTPTPPMPTSTPELPTTTPYSPTTVPQIVTTTPDVPTTPQITTATTYFHITTTEITTPIPTTTPVPTTVPIPTTTPEITTTTTDSPTTTPEITTPIPPMPTTTPELPTTVPIPTTTPEITTDFPTTTPEIPTLVPIIPTTTPEPPPTTTPQIITTSTDLPTTTNAPIPSTTPKSPTTIPESPTTSPQTVSTGGPVVVVSPVDSTGLTTTEIGNSTTAPPKVVDLWMPIVAGVGASMVVLIIVIIIIACVTCCNRPVQLDEKYLTDEEEMLPLGKTNGTAGRAPREKRSDRPNRNSTARKQTETKPKTVEKFRVKESYKSEAEDQISLVKGEEVEVINKPTDDWWFGRSQQKIGWFPTKYLQAAGSVAPTGTENPGFVNDEDSSLPDPPPSLQAMPYPSDTAGSDATLPVRATGETTDDSLRKASLSNISLPPPPPELLAHEDETAPPARSVDNISIGSVSTSASLRNMSLGNLDFSENRQTTPPNGRSGSDSPESVASTAQSVSSSRPPSRASSYMSRTPSTLGSPNIPWMGSVGRSHVRTHPRVKAVLKNGQPDMEENRMHLIMNTNLPDRDASMRSSRSGRSSEDRSGRDRKLSVALRLTEPESALELDLPPPPPEFDSPKPADASPLTERYIAVYGYRATDDNQLNLEEDDVITVHERDPLGWARGVCIQTGKEGWFPESYVKKLGEDKKDSKATRTPGPPQRPAPKPPTDKAKRDEAESSSAPDPSVQSGQGTLTRKELRPRPSVRKSLMNRQPSVKGPSDTDDGPGRPMVAVRPSSHEQPAPPHQNRGTFGAPPPPIKSERSPNYSTSERKPSVRESGPLVQGSVQVTGPSTSPVKPPRQPSQRHSVATTPKPPTIVRSPSRRVSMPINFDLLEESSIDDTPSQGSHKQRRPPNLNLGSFQPHPQQEVGPTSPLSRSRPSRSSVTAAPDIMKTLEELDLQDTQLRTAIETFTMRGPGYLNFTKGDVILELEESDIPGWSYGELQDGTRGIFPVSSTENAATFV